MMTLMLLLITWALPAGADQLGFDRRVTASQVHLDYRFRHADGRIDSLALSLPRTALHGARRQMPRIDAPEVTQRWQTPTRAFEARQVAAQKQAMGDFITRLARQTGARITARDRDGGLSWSIRAASRTTIADIDARLRAEWRRLDDRRRRAVRAFAAEAQQAAWEAANYTAVDAARTRVRPDYARLVQGNTGAMAPVGQALARGEDSPRGKLARALGFFQSIPYDELTDGDGVGYVPPLVMLDINHGDCDTKSAALAASLPALLPGRHAIMVLLPGHALLGVDIPADRGDVTLDHGGRRYVLMEPAGPGLMPVGRVFGATERQLRTHRPTIVPLI